MASNKATRDLLAVLLDRKDGSALTISDVVGSAKQKEKLDFLVILTKLQAETTPKQFVAIFFQICSAMLLLAIKDKAKNKELKAILSKREFKQHLKPSNMSKLTLGAIGAFAIVRLPFDKGPKASLFATRPAVREQLLKYGAIYYPQTKLIELIAGSLDYPGGKAPAIPRPLQAPGGDKILKAGFLYRKRAPKTFFKTLNENRGLLTRDNAKAFGGMISIKIEDMEKKEPDQRKLISKMGLIRDVPVPARLYNELYAKSKGGGRYLTAVKPIRQTATTQVKVPTKKAKS